MSHRGALCRGACCLASLFFPLRSGDNPNLVDAGLPQSEKACDENHHDNDANDVKNVHDNFSSLSRDRIIFTLQIDPG
jgi:hypothetical protein